MQHELLVPQWARNNPNNLLSFLCHYAGLYHSPSSGIAAWAEAAGLTRKTVYNAIARGNFNAKVARLLVSTLPEGVMHAYWLMDPQSIRITERGTIVYGH